MFDLASLASKLPAVSNPIQKLTFKQKMFWTAIILVIYFILGSVFVWGVNTQAIAQFEFLEIVFGSKFGSLITLGIGPIVTASIILQLLVGSKLLPWDLKDENDKAKFMGLQKILTIAFCFIEAAAYVSAGAIPPKSPELAGFIILELAIGGILVMFMDEVASKWGIGSGISLFIAAGVSKTIFVSIFTPLTASGSLPIQEAPVGIIPLFLNSLATGQPAFVPLLRLVSTLIVFLIVLFAQDVRIEIPMAFSLPFGKLASRRWPLKFIYTSNIPVILTAAVVANLQVFGRLLFSRGITFLGEYDATGRATSGFMFLVSSPQSSSLVIPIILAGILGLAFAYLSSRFVGKYVIRLSFLGGVVGLILGYLLVSTSNIPGIAAFTSLDGIHALVYMIVFIIGSVIFSIFWVNTAGMDAKSVSEQFREYSIMIPGFRHDPRIVEKVLEKYIPALTILGGAFIGFLASFADLTLAIGTGTGILLTVMIIYQFYEQITSQHYDDLPPIAKRIMGV